MTSEDSGVHHVPHSVPHPDCDQSAMDAEPMRLALHRLGLLSDDEEAILTPLTGGIASDIWKVELPHMTVCIKRALHRLKVKADWFVPIERNLYEWLYYEIADRAAPGAARHCRSVPHRRHLLCVANGILPGSRCTRTSRHRGAHIPSHRRNDAHEACACARRREPKEHPQRTERTGPFGPGMCVLR